MNLTSITPATTDSPGRTGRTGRTGRVTLAAATAVLALTLAGCGAAESAVQGAQDAAAGQASQAVGDAKAQATEMAVNAVRGQICALVKDGSLSDADAKALEGLATAGTQAGVPAEIIDLVKTVADAGKAATSGQVSDLRAKVCA